jgi:hypothetical protein
LTVFLAALSGIVTNYATDKQSSGWWVALGVLVFVGAIVQIALSRISNPTPNETIKASGDGAVAIGGSSHGPIKTKVSGRTGSPNTHPDDTPGATGAGSVVVRGNTNAAIETDVTIDWKNK